MRVDRDTLLKELEMVSFGLSQREEINQSSCFLFQDGILWTYNDEISCRIKTSLPIEGAVQAKPLLEIVRKADSEELKIEQGENKLIIRGEKFKSVLGMEKEVRIELDKENEPSEWVPLNEDFSEAISMVQECAATDESMFELTCINICPDKIESCNGRQLAIYRIETNLKKSFLCRRNSIRQMVSLNMTEFSEAPVWVHFRNPSGLIYSCRRFVDYRYPELEKILNFTGIPVSLPKDLKDTIERVEIFSGERLEDMADVHILPNKMKITGQNAFGWLTEIREVQYSGEPIAFRIPPKLLLDISKRFSDILIGKDRIKVEAGKYVFVASIIELDKE